MLRVWLQKIASQANTIYYPGILNEAFMIWQTRMEERNREIRHLSQRHQAVAFSTRHAVTRTFRQWKDNLLLETSGTDRVFAEYMMEMEMRAEDFNG
ncbi:hypothetical protein BC937DRAFT_92062 [Endogone sp. FLAS-F59071]|nr:hypothetical protein BC937DRAFT_92062 [Endogone sp. FLAS-F59071]|eukprot:RUS23129.1 hypothetical protein BC937DRAFT_92062 [Endogone sp. FLAS-F59071]